MTATVPAVSVVLPTHNRRATLGRAIGSVLGQSFADFELIVVDDASTDGTRELMRAISDPRLHYVSLPANLGVAGARNAGCAAARADWVAFQDSDDEWLGHKLRDQIAVAQSASKEVGLILGGYRVAGEFAVEVRPEQTLAGRDPRPDLLDGWPIITPTWLVRRELLLALGGFDESFTCLEDWDLVFRLSDRCAIRAVPGPVLLKHGSVDSVCASATAMCAALEAILARHTHRWHGYPRRLARRLAHLGCLQHGLGRRRQARATLARALAHDPWSVPPYALLAAALAGHRFLSLAERAWPRYAGMAL